MKDANILDMLEADAMYIIREALAAAERPLILYSAGKDSAVLLHLALKAFAPALPQAKLLHVDTCWKFREMYEYRDESAAHSGLELIVHRNPEAVKRGINPFEHGDLHTGMWKTDGLKQALEAYRCDLALGGARRDEEKTRAKERIFSLRGRQHGWDPRRQRPELWRVFNTQIGDGQSFRVFPLSDWTERDVWRYIARENIALPGLYFAAERNVLEVGGSLLVVDDKRFPMHGRIAEKRMVRFRSLGCYPLTAAIESDADTVEKILIELDNSSQGERAGRTIDKEDGTLERKKSEGYF